MWRRVWIHKRKNKKGRSYSIRWYNRRGRMRCQTTGPDKRLAERLRVCKEAEINSASYEEIERISYDDFVTEELAVIEGRLAAKSVVEAARALRHFGEICGPRAIADIDLAMVERFYSARLDRVARATANKELRTVKAAFNRAVRRNYLRENPAQYVKPVRVPEKALRVLSPDDVSRLLNACPSITWQAFIALAVTTGMRLGELQALRWCDVELDSLTVHVRNTRDHVTKSGKVRAMAMRVEVAAMLEQLDRGGERVFDTADGSLRAHSVQQDFNAIVKRSGIERCTLHDLRRTFVSQLAMAGVNQAVVQKLAGHASITTTTKHYTHIIPAALRSATERLPFDEVLRACVITD
jgi:integrase